MEPLVEHPYDGPALAQVVQLAERAQVAEDVGRIVAVIEPHDRVRGAPRR